MAEAGAVGPAGHAVGAVVDTGPPGVPPAKSLKRIFRLEKSARATEKLDDTKVLLFNPTNAVGGTFILSLQWGLGGRESHQRSWWIVHTQATLPLEFTFWLMTVRLDMNDPPTALVGFKRTLRSFE